MPNDIAIASMLNAQLKNCAATAALSACECTSPELRATLAEISQSAIRRQEQLAALASQKGWYVPPVADAATVVEMTRQLQAAMGELGAEAAQSATPLGVTGAPVGVMAAPVVAAAPRSTGGVTAPRIV